MSAVWQTSRTCNSSCQSHQSQPAISEQNQYLLQSLISNLNVSIHLKSQNNYHSPPHTPLFQKKHFCSCSPLAKARSPPRRDPNDPNISPPQAQGRPRAVNARFAKLKEPTKRNIQPNPPKKKKLDDGWPESEKGKDVDVKYIEERRRCEKISEERMNI